MADFLPLPESMSVTQYRELGVEGCLESFKSRLELFVRNWLEIGKILCALKELGYDIAKFEMGAYVTEVAVRVGRGEAHSDVLSLLWSKPSLCRQISLLPMADQKRIVKEQAVDVYEEIDGKPTFRKVPVEKLTPLQRAIALDSLRNRYRTQDEQAILFSGQKLQVKVSRSRKVIEFDESTGLFVEVTGITFEEMEQWIKERKSKRRKRA